MRQVDILLADDHKIIRDGISSLFSDEPGFNIIAEAENGNEVLILLKAHSPDIVIMDISMPGMDGIECTNILKQLYPDLPVLILSTFNEEEYVTQVFKSGASGYILKNSGKEELIQALNSILSGKPFYCSEVTQTYIESQTQPKVNKSKSQEILDTLSEREMEILLLIIHEHSNSEMADTLFISVRTVDAHRRNLLNKTGLKNTAGLVKFAIAANLLNDS